MTIPNRTKLAYLALMILLASCQGSTTSPEAQADAVASISGASIRKHMEILASDDMQGREAGTKHYRKAADYVAEQYQLAGLQPLGDAGTYFQDINFLETRLVPESAQLTLHKATDSYPLTFREDFIRRGGYGEPDEAVSAGLVFAGHGIQALELGHDDYADIDVSGKIVVVLSGAPPGFATDQRAFYSSGRGKAALAVAQGAVGMISLRTPVDQKRRPWSRYLPGIGSAGMRWTQQDGSPHQGFVELKGSAILSEAGASKLFDLAGVVLATLFEKHAAGGTGSFDLGVSATLARSSTQRRISSANVVGVIPGSDRRLRDEYVIYTGHLDHIGVRPGKDGDDIHNGAYDNAAGVGALLEIARAIAALPTAPKRSVIFCHGDR